MYMLAEFQNSRGYACVTPNKCDHLLTCRQDKMWQSWVDHYCIAYFDHVTMFDALQHRMSIKGRAHTPAQTYSCIYPACMSPALDRSSVLQYFELCKIHKRVMFNFYPRLQVADNFEMKWWQIALLVIAALAMVPGIMLIIIGIVVYCRRKNELHACLAVSVYSTIQFIDCMR